MRQAAVVKNELIMMAICSLLCMCLGVIRITCTYVISFPYVLRLAHCKPNFKSIIYTALKLQYDMPMMIDYA